MVWPAYVREHGWMFEGGDVDFGAPRSDLRCMGAGGTGKGDASGVRVGPGFGDKGMNEILEWAVSVLGQKVGSEIERLSMVARSE